MNNFKGTKGKWAVENASNPNGSFYRVKVDNSESICNITTRDTERSRLNACLIAAAPEMLQRLKSVQLMLMAHPDYVVNENQEFIDQVDSIEEVIAKALNK